MASDLSSAVVDYLKRAGRSCTTLEIAKAVGKPRKELNRTIYELQRKGVLLRVQESPPLWELAQNMRGAMNRLRGGATRIGRGRGRGRSPTPPTSGSAGYSFQHQKSFNFPAPVSSVPFGAVHSSAFTNTGTHTSTSSPLRGLISS